LQARPQHTQVKPSLFGQHGDCGYYDIYDGQSRCFANKFRLMV